jgi:hypothetical protein
VKVKERSFERQPFPDLIHRSKTNDLITSATGNLGLWLGKVLGRNHSTCWSRVVAYRNDWLRNALAGNLLELFPSNGDARATDGSGASPEDAMRIAFATLALAAAFSLPALAADQVEKAPPTGAYKKVSELVKIPDFLPGLGQLYVDPKTLPAGPFLAYDREGRLVSTVYMLPIEDLSNKDKRFDDLAAPGGKVDHVDVYFNAGHPGVEKPHAHVVLWHVPKADEQRVAAK